MSNDDSTSTDPEGGATDNMRELREAADRGRSATRENAFLKAGIDTDTAVGRMFLKAYDGELTKEAITVAATEVGAIKAAPAAAAAAAPTAEEVARAAEAAEHQQTRQRLSGGDSSGDTPPADPDPYDEAMGNFHKDMDKGMTRKNAGYAAIDRILQKGGASHLDERVLLRDDQ